MKILVTGANGQLGNEVRILAKQHSDWEFIFSDISRHPDGEPTEFLDITSPIALEGRLDAIINCAAYTNVDAAEDNEELAYKLNATAAGNLAQLAKSKGATLIHISTDYVFDGEKNVPYVEEDVPIPSSTYGKTKLEAERLIIYSDINAIVIRTAWLYSTYGKNYVKSMIKYGNERDEMNIVFDQVGTPTYARDLADTILKIIPQLQKMEKPYREIFHFTNDGVCSWYDFTKHIYNHEGIKCKVNPIRTSDYPTPAQRPAYSVLDKSKIKKTFGIDIPYWTDSLDAMLNKLNSKQ